MAKARFLIASCFGIGRFPVAPGTVGSAAGLLLYWALSAGGGWLPALLGLVVVTALGFWSAGAGEERYGEKDPGVVVIDEVAGQMLTLLWLGTTWQILLAGFLLFRLLDIIKPFPARRLEKLPGGSGIMADDLMVGLYGNLILRAIALLAPGWLGLTL
jgi:phosphatidylglycerophosphatase A